MSSRDIILATIICRMHDDDGIMVNNAIPQAIEMIQ